MPNYNNSKTINKSHYELLGLYMSVIEPAYSPMYTVEVPSLWVKLDGL